MYPNQMVTNVGLKPKLLILLISLLMAVRVLSTIEKYINHSPQPEHYYPASEVQTQVYKK